MSTRKRCRNVLYFAPRLLLASVFMVVIGAIALSNFDTLEPYLAPLHLAQKPATCYGSSITMGPFPELADLVRLKKERGIDLDISLLDDDLPQEKALDGKLAREDRGLDIEYMNVPLNYLRLNGAVSKKRIADLAAFLKAHPKRKVYIHCYLGRHRVGAVREELMRQGVIAPGESVAKL